MLYSSRHRLRLLVLGLLFHSLIATLAAETLGPFTYTKYTNSVSINRCSTAAEGDIVIPREIEGVPVTFLDDSAFWYCVKVTSVYVPSSVQNIQGYTFADCTNLRSVYIEDGPNLIYRNAFENCTSLTDIRLPDTVLKIEQKVFEGCSSLSTIKIPKSASSIDLRFFGCTSLTSIEVHEENTTYSSLDGVLFNADKTTLYRYPYAKTASHYTLPDTVTKINTSAFKDTQYLASITLNESLEIIGDSAFSGNTLLTTITLPKTYTGGNNKPFNDGIFSRCTKLAEINIHPDNPYYKSIDGVVFDKEGTILYAYPRARTGGYTIPDGVVTIDGSVFFGNPFLTYVSIPNGVTKLSGNCFYACKKLETVKLPDSIEEIGDHCFSECSRLTHINMPAELRTIGTGAFYYCSPLKDVKLPPKLETIEAAALKNTSIERIVFPASIKSLGGDLFGATNNLTEMYFLGNAVYYSGGSTPVSPSEKLTLYYLRGNTGFDRNPWVYHNLVEIDQSVYPAAKWLIENDLPYSENLEQDTNEDGVPLLMEYALGLQPGQHNASKMPQLQLDESQASLTFKGDSLGITYEVWTSTNLSDWTQAGVTISTPDAQGNRTASIPRSSPSAFLQLRVAP